jgi:aminodeoxyfutalosine deaminase
MTTSSDSFIYSLPKIELHIHLEGSVQPDTLRELAQAKGRFETEAEAWIWERERTGYRYGEFMDFVEAFKFVAVLLETPQDYALATRRLLEWLAAQNVRYAEITLSAGVVLWKKQSLEAVYEAIRQAALEAEPRLGLRVNWIFDAVRQFGADHARQVADWAARYRSEGVAAFGLGGDEARGPAELFVDVFHRARDAGLHTVCHAGETAGPESVRCAVERLGAERIGHGLTAFEDPAVVALLRDRKIPLEICPTSNVSIGILKSFEDYPMRQILDEGLTVTLNSDDPALFGTSIQNEFEKAAETFGLSRRELAGFAENAARAVFLPEDDRRKLLEEVAAARA